MNKTIFPFTGTVILLSEEGPMNIILKDDALTITDSHDIFRDYLEEGTVTTSVVTAYLSTGEEVLVSEGDLSEWEVFP